MVNFLGTPQAKKSLIGSSSQKKDIPKEISNISIKMGELSERTRLLEERMKNSREKIQVLDETFSSKIKDLKDATSDFKRMVDDLKKEIDSIKEIMRRVIKELNSTAKLSDVRVLEKYISMVDITRIVTKEDVREIVEEIIKKKKLR